VPVGDAPEGVVVDALSRTVAVAKRNPNELVLLNADTGDVTKRVSLGNRGHDIAATRQSIVLCTVSPCRLH
jgi:DNA-binding beta-propeller fold protein YncE